MYKKIVLLFLLAASAGNFQAQVQKNKQNEEKWSIRMANTILSRSDSLIYYVDRNPKWTYDVAFLGMAIDRLGNTDIRYSKYMDDWVNHFVKTDGSVVDYRLKEYNLDRIFPGRDVITVYKRNPDPKYKIALDNFIEQLKNNQKLTPEVIGIKIFTPGRCGLTVSSWHRHIWLSMQKNSTLRNGLI